METAVVVEDLDVDGLIDVLDGDGERLVPLRIQVLVDGLASVYLLAPNLEFHVRIARPYLWIQIIEPKLWG